MADCLKLTKKALWDALRAEGPIFAPTAEGRWAATEELPALGAIRPRRPLRDLFIPPVREIAIFSREIARTEIRPAEIDRSKAVVFGARPCDARALLWLDKIFLAAPHVDQHYKARREATLLIGHACDVSESCHCGLFGYGPDEPAGLDVMLYPRGEAFLAVAGSDQGAKFLKGIRGEKAGVPEKRPGPKPDWWTRFPSPKALLAAFEHPIWAELQVGCMNCGACTLYCPTCQCFNIVDEPFKGDIHRRRVIDTCQHSDFTRMAGGHNPRQKRHPRLRQRVLHKFAYIPLRNQGELGCSGCGRCVELCGLRRHLFADLVDIGNRIGEEASCGS